ncbi:MAG: MBL fold metallo-hydrolase, partial [Lachnospiraceae bacterium]|nr:MBL fold metallo-hydrolase [Lachnospiraceae bacterium]
LVECRFGATIELVYVVATPPGKSHYERISKEHGEPYFGDDSDDSYIVVDGPSYDCHNHIDALHLYTPHFKIPKHILRNYPDRIEMVSGDYKLCDGVYLIPHKTPGLEKIGKREAMYQKTGNGLVPDNFSHEQSLVLDTDKGLVILNSCSHGGTINIINEVKSTFPHKHVHALIGGFHLFNKPEDEIRATAKAIKETGIDYVCTGHCTKDRAYGIMKEELGDSLEQLRAGLVMEF